MATGHRALLEGYRTRLFALFSRHAPDRVEDITELLTKNRGKEYDLYCRVCRKYDVTPDARYQIRLQKDAPRKFKKVAGPKLGNRRPPGRPVPTSTVGRGGRGNVRGVATRAKRSAVRQRAQQLAEAQAANRAPRFNLRAYRRNQAAQILTEAQKKGEQGRKETTVRKMTRDVATQEEIALRQELVEEFHAEVGMSKMGILEKSETQRINAQRARLEERAQNLSRRDAETKEDVQQKQAKREEFLKEVKQAKSLNEASAADERQKVMQQRTMERDQNLMKRDTETRADVENKKSKIKLFQEASKELKKSIHDESERERLHVMLARTEERDQNLRKREMETRQDVQNKREKIAEFQSTVESSREQQQQYFEEQRKLANQERIRERENNIMMIDISTKQDVARKQAKIEQFKQHVQKTKVQIEAEKAAAIERVATERLMERTANLTKRDAATEEDQALNKMKIETFKQEIAQEKRQIQQEMKVKRLSVGQRRKRERQDLLKVRDEDQQKDIAKKKKLIAQITSVKDEDRPAYWEQRRIQSERSGTLHVERVEEREVHRDMIQTSTERDIASKQETARERRDEFKGVIEKVEQEKETYRDEAHRRRAEERDRNRRKIERSAEQDQERKRRNAQRFKEETVRLAREREKLRKLKLAEVNVLHKAYRNANLSLIQLNAAQDREQSEDHVFAARQEAMRLLQRKLAKLTLQDRKRNKRGSMMSDQSYDWERRREQLETSFGHIFDRFDKDEDGLLSFEEFRSAVSALGFAWGDAVIRDVFDQMDFAGNGSLDLNAFKVGMRVLENMDSDTASNYSNISSPCMMSEAALTTTLDEHALVIVSGEEDGNHSANVSLPSTPEKTEFPDLPYGVATPRPGEAVAVPEETPAVPEWTEVPDTPQAVEPARGDATPPKSGRPRGNSTPVRGAKYARSDKVVFKSGGRHAGKLGIILGAEVRGRPENPDTPLYSIQLDTGNEVEEIKETRLNLVARASSIRGRLSSPRESWFAPQKHKPELGDRVKCVQEINYRFGDVIVKPGDVGSVACEDPLRVYWDGTDVKRGTVSMDAITFTKRKRHIPIPDPPEAPIAKSRSKRSSLGSRSSKQ